MFFKKRLASVRQLDRVAWLYLAFKFFSTLYFSYPVFYEFASQIITPIQIGMFFSIIGACGLIAEIPTGILADTYSRKLSGLLGMIAATVAPLILLFGNTFAAYIIAAVFYGVGRASLNGALDSLIYDHKNITKVAYRRINLLEITFGQAGILVGAACGGVLFAVTPGLPFVADAITGLICICLIAAMREQYSERQARPTLSHSQHFMQSLQHLTATPYLRVLVFAGTLFSVMLGVCIQFIHEAAMIEHGFQSETRGFLISGAGILTLLALNTFLFTFLSGDIRRIIYIGCGSVAAYWCMSAGNMSLFLFGYLVWCCLNATSSFIRVILQDHIPGSHRSTILSSFKTLAILVGLGASTGVGVLVQWAHTPRAAYILFGIIASVIVLPCMTWLAIHLKIRRVMQHLAGVLVIA